MRGLSHVSVCLDRFEVSRALLARLDLTTDAPQTPKDVIHGFRAQSSVPAIALWRIWRDSSR